LYENIERVSQSVLEGIRNMWNQINEIARAHTNKATSSTKDEVETSEGNNTMRCYEYIKEGLTDLAILIYS
jgi:hypothetical protein